MFSSITVKKRSDMENQNEQYFVITKSKKGYVFCGDDTHDTIESALKEASLFYADDEKLIALVKVDLNTGKTESIYDDRTFEDRVREWDFDQMSEADQEFERRENAIISRWEEQRG